MTHNDLQAIKDRIINELRPIMPDIKVAIYIDGDTVHNLKCTTIMGDEHYLFGPRAYVGMQEAHIWVYWDKFYDRLCGNGWMYGQDTLFKFDIKDGDCKYCDKPTFIQEYIGIWIDKKKKEYAELQANWEALPQ